VQRLTAPNPGAMTGPGTNSYLVGEPATGYIAIDPGPNDAAHLERLWAAARDEQGVGGDIRMIVCTHSHPDHSPGAARFKPCARNAAAAPRRCSACPRPQPPALPAPSHPTDRYTIESC
jgi:recombination protein RecT